MSASGPSGPLVCISGTMDQYILSGYAVLCKVRNGVPCLDLVT